MNIVSLFSAFASEHTSLDKLLCVVDNNDDTLYFFVCSYMNRTELISLYISECNDVYCKYTKQIALCINPCMTA
jgi:hypothetical protein